jgi:thiol-disulfide isomerase/thioredoxin
MVQIRKTWLLAFLLGLGCLVADARVGAGEDKKVAKKKEEPKGASLLKKSGELKEDDAKDSKLQESPSQMFPIKLVAGKSYQIDLKSTDFDSFLRLLDSKGDEVAFDDDGGGFPDARIIYKAAKTGEFKIVVTSFDKKAGAFVLTVVELGGKGGPAPGASKFTAKAIELKLKNGKVTHESYFNDEDPVVQNHYYKVFTVKLEKDTTYRIDHKDRGDDPMFDPFLFLEDSDGKTLANDDDSGGGLNSRIIYKVTKSGTYRIIATTLPPKQTGKFTIEIGAPTPEEAKEANLKSQVSEFATLTAAQKKTLVDEIRKSIASKDGNLTIGQAQLVFQLGVELEGDDVKLARALYKDAIKEFSAARDAKISAQVTSAFEGALKSLEKIGTVVEITGKTLAGKDFDLKNMKGKVVLVDFWGTWCPPCVAEIPNIVAAYEKYHGKGFDVIGISSDKSDEVVTGFMNGRKLPWSCINIEDSRKLIEANGIMAYPTTMLIDQSGRLVSMRARGPQLERLLERLLTDKK